MKYNERLILPKQARYVSVNHADWIKMSMHLWEQMCEVQLY